MTFSRSFTEEEVTARWRALLFDPAVARPAAVRMANAQRVAPPPPPAGDDMQTIVAAWRSTRAAATAGEAGVAAPPPPDGGAAGASPSFSEVCSLLLRTHAGAAAQRAHAARLR